MQHKLSVIIFLLSSFSMHAMKLTTPNHSNGIPLTNDLFTISICSRLDRPARDALRCTCKKYLALVHSQEELNKHHQEVYDKIGYGQNIQDQLVYWKNLGGMFPHQELASAVKNKKEKLAVWLLETKRVNIIFHGYYWNMQDAVETSTVDEIVPVIQWLLDATKPLTDSRDFLSAYNYANDRKKRYPDMQKFVDLFDKYKEEEKREIARIVAESRRNNAYSSSPWHARGDYL